MKRLTLETNKRIGYEGCYFLIVPDHAAGKRNRFTLYRVPTAPRVAKSGGVKVLGRELTLAHCRRLAHTAKGWMRPRGRA